MSSMVTDVSLNCELVERLFRKRDTIFADYSTMTLDQKNLAHIQSLQDKIQINKVQKFINEELHEELDVVIQSLLEQV